MCYCIAGSDLDAGTKTVSWSPAFRRNRRPGHRLALQAVALGRRFRVNPVLQPKPVSNAVLYIDIQSFTSYESAVQDRCFVDRSGRAFSRSERSNSDCRHNHEGEACAGDETVPGQGPGAEGCRDVAGARRLHQGRAEAEDLVGPVGGFHRDHHQPPDSQNDPDAEDKPEAVGGPCVSVGSGWGWHGEGGGALLIPPPPARAR